ncbi:hypothetical protein AgCh_023832 [Apium graveolens]
MVSQEVKQSVVDGDKAPLFDVTQLAYFKVFDKGSVSQPIIVNAKNVSKIAERKIKEAGGAVKWLLFPKEFTAFIIDNGMPGNWIGSKQICCNWVTKGVGFIDDKEGHLQIYMISFFTSFIESQQEPMTSDRSWIGRHRFNEAKYLTEDYKNGVDNFIKFAIENLDPEDNGLIRCPCKNYGNEYYKYPSTVKVDLYRHGIMQWYTRWDCHGEKDVLRNDVGTSFGNTSYRGDDMYDAHDDDFEDCEDFDEEPNAKAKEFYEMVNTASEPIYPNNGNFTTLEFVMELLRWKNRHTLLKIWDQTSVLNRC